MRLPSSLLPALVIALTAAPSWASDAALLDDPYLAPPPPEAQRAPAQVDPLPPPPPPAVEVPPPPPIPPPPPPEPLPPPPVVELPPPPPLPEPAPAAPKAAELPPPPPLAEPAPAPTAPAEPPRTAEPAPQPNPQPAPPPAPTEPPQTAEPAPPPVVVEPPRTAEPARPATPKAQPEPAQPTTPPGQQPEKPAVTCEGTETGAPPVPPTPTFGFSGETPAVGELTRTPGNRAGFGLGLQQLERDFLLVANVGTTFELGPVGIGIQAPLRFRVWNLDERKLVFQLRREDWDEVADFLKILRYVEYGKPPEKLYARWGELTATTLGHGTIVNGYFNSVDVDHWQAGVRFNLNLPQGGVETLLNSVAHPRLFGARLYVRPFQFIDPCSFWTRLAVGASAFTDREAPTTLVGATVDEVGNLNAPSRAMAVTGLDADLTVFSNALFDLTPYVDLNFLGTMGTGLHAGALVGLHPAVVSAQARLEYRALSARYLPTYFDALYEVERFQYRGTTPKLAYVEAGGAGEARQGYYGELLLQAGDALSLMAGLEDYQGPHNASFKARLLLPELMGFRLGGYYTKRDFEKLDELLDRDRALGIAELRYTVSGVMSLVAQVSRQWRLENGLYQATDSWAFGTDFSWTW